jgi:hypothetical protein
MPPSKPNQPLLLVDAARILLVGERGTRVLADRGELPCERTPSGIRIFRRGDVERLAAERAKRQAERRGDGR